MTEVHILAEIGWEYNDEHYYRPESDGVRPVKAYSSLEEARRAVVEETYEWLRSASRGQYACRTIFEQLWTYDEAPDIKLNVLNSLFQKHDLLEYGHSDPDRSEELAEAKLRVSKIKTAIDSVREAGITTADLNYQLSQAKERVRQLDNQPWSGLVRFVDDYEFNYFPKLPDDMPLEDKQQLIHALGLELYEIRTVELE